MFFSVVCEQPTSSRISFGMKSDELKWNKDGCSCTYVSVFKDSWNALICLRVIFYGHLVPVCGRKSRFPLRHEMLIGQACDLWSKFTSSWQINSWVWLQQTAQRKQLRSSLTSISAAVNLVQTPPHYICMSQSVLYL